jgi:hypothetical protein
MLSQRRNLSNMTDRSADRDNKSGGFCGENSCLMAVPLLTFLGSPSKDQTGACNICPSPFTSNKSTNIYVITTLINSSTDLRV